MTWLMELLARWGLLPFDLHPVEDDLRVRDLEGRLHRAQCRATDRDTDRAISQARARAAEHTAKLARDERERRERGC